MKGILYLTAFSYGLQNKERVERKPLTFRVVQTEVCHL